MDSRLPGTHASRDSYDSSGPRFKFYYQNVRGLNTKSQQVFNFTSSQYNPLDFIALTETWLNDGVFSSELFPLH